MTENTSSGSCYVAIPDTDVLISPEYSHPPPDYEDAAFFSCLFCFCPTALVACYFAKQSKRCYSRNDIVGAHEAATKARKFVTLSFALGTILYLVTAALLGIFISYMIS